MSAQCMDYILSQPESVKNTMLELREIILGVNPNIRERFTYGGVFFETTSLFCYLGKTSKNKVYISFVQGERMGEKFPFLDGKGVTATRKYYYDPDTPNFEELEELLNYAIELSRFKLPWLKKKD
jgi:hypothetical protein